MSRHNNIQILRKGVSYHHNNIISIYYPANLVWMVYTLFVCTQCFTQPLGDSCSNNITTRNVCCNQYNMENSLSSLSSVISLQLNVNSVRGRVNGRRIQCTFAATVPDSSTSISTRASNVAVAISTGPFNSSKLPFYGYTFTQDSCHKHHDR